jgi:transposase
MHYEDRTKHFVDEHLRRGKTKKEIVRILKRYIAREVYQLLNPRRRRQHTPLDIHRNVNG